jgi:hypothetical protein
MHTPTFFCVLSFTVVFSAIGLSLFVAGSALVTDAELFVDSLNLIDGECRVEEFVVRSSTVYNEVMAGDTTFQFDAGETFRAIASVTIASDRSNQRWAAAVFGVTFTSSAEEKAISQQFRGVAVNDTVACGVVDDDGSQFGDTFIAFTEIDGDGDRLDSRKIVVPLQIDLKAVRVRVQRRTVLFAIGGAIMVPAFLSYVVLLVVSIGRDVNLLKFLVCDSGEERQRRLDPYGYELRKRMEEARETRPRSPKTVEVEQQLKAPLEKGKQETKIDVPVLVTSTTTPDRSRGFELVDVRRKRHRRSKKTQVKS